ncbi:hypothetical protein D3C73_1237590 [compost metagenome]
MSIVIKRNLNLIQIGSFNRQGEQMMTVLSIKLFTAKTINAADHFRMLIAICEQCGLNLIYHITAVSTIRICTIAYSNSLHIFESLCNLLLRERTNHVRSNGARLDALTTQIINYVFNNL